VFGPVEDLSPHGSFKAVSGEEPLGNLAETECTRAREVMSLGGAQRPGTIAPSMATEVS
jgi:hypothetical protein